MLKIIYDYAPPKSIKESCKFLEGMEIGIEEILKKYGYVFDSSGYDFETHKRDLLFELPPATS